MRLVQYIADMQTTTTTLESILSSIGMGEARWKPGAERWSILEVVNHMVDEESEDFRYCVQLLLQTPEKDWPNLQSWSWVESRDYNARELEESLARFKIARQDSIIWLGDLSDPPWDNRHTGRHSFDAPMTAGEATASRVAHDFFHIGQIQTLRWEYLNASEGSFSTVYAGEIYWRPEGSG